jgi:uncharacterized protein
MASDAKNLRIQVCYAKPDLQLLKELIVAEGATMEEAIRLSGLVNEASDIDLAAYKVGIYGKLKPLDTRLREGDRIEIYRPLLADPKDARRRRAQKNK